MAGSLEIPEAPQIDYASLGVYDQDEAAENAFARVLLLGASKIGKTTCIAMTAPDPFIINCDGDSSLKYAKKQGAKFRATDALSQAGWRKACNTAKTLVESGACRSVIVDTISMLADNLQVQLAATREGYDLYGELMKEIMGGVRKLLKLPAHVFFVAHISPDWDEVSGVMPMIAGSSKARIPALVDDWVLLDVDPERDPQRMFVLGTHKKWAHSGRNIKRSCMIEATVPRLFEELGIRL